MLGYVLLYTGTVLLYILLLQVHGTITGTVLVTLQQDEDGESGDANTSKQERHEDGE